MAFVPSGLTLRNDRALFVVVSVAVNLLFILRSYITMRVLGFAELGLTALLQTIVLLVAALQFGVVNGAYRLACSEPPEVTHRVNNLVYTFTAALAVPAFVAALIAVVWSGGHQLGWTAVVLLGVATGLFTILRTWITNYMIARVMLPTLNLLNVVSAAVSLAPLALVGFWPLPMCLLAIVLQPVVFVVHALLAQPQLRPTAPEASRPLFRRIMAAGFVVFLTSVFLVANAQIERWSTLTYLGLNGLGHFYLALLFLNLYTLVPTSLDAIYLPKLVQAHTAGDPLRVRADMGRFFRVLLAYSAAVVVAVFGLAPVILGALLPKYLPDLRYVYLLLPGVVLFGLTAPFAMVFNILIRYRFYFIAYGLGTVLTAALLGGYVLATGSLSLTALSIIKSVVFVAMGAIILVGYVALSRGHPAFRFAPFRLGGATAP
jgi:O-antigen/teichoic acid export membrane protein